MRDALVLVADQRFQLGCAATAVSAARATSRPLDLHLLDAGLDPAFVARLAEVVGALPGGHVVHRHEVAPFVADLPLPPNPAFSRAIYGRLAAPRLVGGGRLLYLDCDMVVREDLVPLFDHDLRGAAVGAVQDLGILRRSLHVPADRPYFEDVLGGRPLDGYVNSGLLLVDVAAWNAAGLTTRAAEWLAAHPRLQYPDQDALNAVVGDRLHVLPDRWNVMGAEHPYRADRNLPAALRKRLQRAFADVAIFHYTHRKPWTPHPVARRAWFREALAGTPWADERPVWPASAGERRLLLKAWRRHLWRFRIGLRRIDVRVLGRPLWQWRSSRLPPRRHGVGDEDGGA